MHVPFLYGSLPSTYSPTMPVYIHVSQRTRKTVLLWEVVTRTRDPRDVTNLISSVETSVKWKLLWMLEYTMHLSGRPQ